MNAVPFIVPAHPAARRGGIVAIVCLLLGGCASDLLMLGPAATPANVELPSGAPRVVGAESATAREHKRLVDAFGGEYPAPAVQAILSSLLIQLRNGTDLPGLDYKVTILNSGLVNAFALPNGHLYVTRGLLILANDQSEVASVLAHEIAHVTARHAMERAELENRSILVSRVRAEVLNNPGAAQLVRDQAQVAIASFSRNQELEADKLGVRTLSVAGFDPYGAHRFLHALDRNSALLDRQADSRGQSQKLDFTATHPTTPDRIQQALLAARQHGAPGVVPVERNRWLNALTGMIYGEDSKEGFVRGRTFLHPRLGISFTAPDGFVLENSAQAVLGMTEGATEALRFDSARIAQDKPLDEFIRENRIEGLDLTDIQTLAVNGHSAATGLARGADWTFRIFAVRIGPQVYRMIMAARQFTPETDRRFMAAFESFRKLTAEEQARARPLRIAIHTARRGETPDDLSQRMGGVNRPLERFLIINGLEQGANLEPGRLYKTIID